MKALTGCLINKNKSNNETVIDLGCGTGSYSTALSEAGFSVLGVDFSPKMVEKAKNKIKNKNNGFLDLQLLNLNLKV